jgi:hypothetical protein
MSSVQPSPGSIDMGPSFVLCQCPANPPLPPYLTIRGDCNSPCTIVGAEVKPPALFAYKLPSGEEVVGCVADFQRDEGTLVYRMSPHVEDPSTIAGTQKVVCRLRSGLGVIQTYANCVKNGGKVIGIILGRIQKT